MRGVFHCVAMPIPQGVGALHFGSMAQRQHHYERAFEAYLRQRRIPYVAVDEAKRALLPEGGPALRLEIEGESAGGVRQVRVLKSFDFVIYGHGEAGNLLVDVKGRKIARRVLAQRTPVGELMAPPPRTRLENWATLDDIESLRVWEGLFGAGFRGALVFVYWCEEQPPDALFHEVFDFEGRWYAMRSVPVQAYESAMKVRSPRWRTVDLPAGVFDRISQPLGPSWLGSVGA